MDRVLSGEEERIQWKEEAESVIQDIKDFVKCIGIAGNVSCQTDRVFLNLTTIENNNYCVELSALGFRIVGNAFDDLSKVDDLAVCTFETPYALLSTISPGYHNLFGNKLIEKLRSLPNQE